MEQFALAPEEYTVGKRFRRQLSLFLYLQIILLLFFGMNLKLEVALLLMYFLMMTLKRNRILYRLIFNDEKQTLELSYYCLIFWERKLTIHYSNLKGSVLEKRFGLGSSVTTLEFYQGKQLVGEIRKAGNWMWNQEQFQDILKKMETIGTI